MDFARRFYIGLVVLLSAANFAMFAVRGDVPHMLSTAVVCAGGVFLGKDLLR